MSVLDWEDEMSRGLGRMRVELGLLLVVLAGPSCAGSRVGDDSLGDPDAGDPDASETDAGETDASETDASETDAGDTSSRPAARGGSRFAVTSGGCNVATAFPIPAEGDATSRIVLGSRVEDGVDGASVTCRVVTSGDGFAFDGNVQEGSRAFTIIANVAPDDAGGHTGIGTVWHTDPNSPALNSDDGACTVTVLPNQDIASGRVWGNFQCATVSANNQPGIACSAEGSFVFENCEE